MIRLGVNIDHVATLRQVRLARYPDIIEALFLCERGGADQITVHLREDRRHIQDEDVKKLVDHSLLPINLEIAATEEMIAFAKEIRPYSVTLVPERREEMTTERGLDLKTLKKMESSIRGLKNEIRVYSFIDPHSEQVEMTKAWDLDGVEFHTGPYAEAFEKSLRGRQDEAMRSELDKLNQASRLAHQQGLEVKAGHGLTLQNMIPIKEIPHLSEVNIGHAIVARALVLGLEAAVLEMRRVLQG